MRATRNSSMAIINDLFLPVFTGDLEVNLPSSRAHPALPDEVDASSGARHFVAKPLGADGWPPAVPVLSALTGIYGESYT